MALHFRIPLVAPKCAWTDINGDGLPDVVTSKEAHGYGLSWFEQVRGRE
jgi:hypothetical protein